MAALSVAGKQNETMWPKDTLFKFLIAMENLQENMKEYQELNLLLSKEGFMRGSRKLINIPYFIDKALLELHDD